MLCDKRDSVVDESADSVETLTLAVIWCATRSICLSTCSLGTVPWRFRLKEVTSPDWCFTSALFLMSFVYLIQTRRQCRMSEGTVDLLSSASLLGIFVLRYLTHRLAHPAASPLRSQGIAPDIVSHQVLTGVCVCVCVWMSVFWVSGEPAFLVSLTKDINA